MTTNTNSPSIDDGRLATQREKAAFGSIFDAYSKVNKYKTYLIGGTAGVLGFMAIILTPESAAAVTIPFGVAESFAVLGASTVTNTGATTINGNVGVYPGSAITGVETISITGGTYHLGDAVAQQAQTDATTAYNLLQGLSVTSNLTGQDLGSFSLPPGVYKYDSSAQLTGPLTLNFAGVSNVDYVFQIGSTLTTASGSSVNIQNGNSTNHVFFQVGSSATLGTGTAFAGNILALQSITLATGATILDGRALALIGAVTMDNNTINNSSLGVSAVPIPGAILLFGTALLGLAASGWRRIKLDGTALLCKAM